MLAARAAGNRDGRTHVSACEKKSPASAGLLDGIERSQPAMSDSRQNNSVSSLAGILCVYRTISTPVDNMSENKRKNCDDETTELIERKLKIQAQATIPPTSPPARAEVPHRLLRCPARAVILLQSRPEPVAYLFSRSLNIRPRMKTRISIFQNTCTSNPSIGIGIYKQNIRHVAR